MELFTMTPWWMIPLFWSFPMIYHTVFENPQPILLGILLFVIGALSWTFYEYCLHRFFFHSEDYWLPNHPLVLANHFMIHGIHHAFPMDRYRLVFPVLPGLAVMYGIIRPSLSLVVPEQYLATIHGGLILGYVCYDLIHYFQHHSSPKSGYFKN